MTKPMTNKQKLKTFEEIVGRNIRSDLAGFLLAEIEEVFNAHHSYLLQLEERIEELEKKLLKTKL